MKWTKELKRRRKRLRRQHQRLCDRYISSFPLRLWHDEIKPDGPIMYFEAESFRPKPILDLKPVFPHELGRGFAKSPKGTLAFQNRVFPKHSLTSLFGTSEQFVTFDGPTVIPSLIDLRRASTGSLFRDQAPIETRVRLGHIWMSLCPGEIISLWPGVERAKGTVLVGGLGLGWQLRKVCQKEDVERVILVEHSQDLLDWYGYDLCGQLEKVTDVICDDVYNQIGRHGNETMHILDIWPIYQGANQDAKLHAAEKQHGDKIWAWGRDPALTMAA